MDTRKEQERAELHRAIWKIANGLRGSVDGWDFKQYVLGMLFYRYISENLAAYVAQGEAEAEEQDETEEGAQEQTEEITFTLPFRQGSFWRTWLMSFFVVDRYSIRMYPNEKRNERKMKEIDRYLDEYYLYDKDPELMEDGAVAGMVYGLYEDDPYVGYYTMEDFESDADHFDYYPVGGTREVQELSCSFGHMVMRIQQLMTTVREEEVNLRKTELKALQAQINPHFLYNTLDSIAWMCEQGRNADAVKMVHALARLFRISISKGHELIPISKEIEHAESYLQIQKYRYKNQFTYHFHVDPTCLNYLCNKITLQPIIENAINHGLDLMVDEGRIDVYVQPDGEDIIFRVEDNGVGMSQEQIVAILEHGPKERTGIGIRNVNDRLQIYFGKEYGLTITSKLDVGTCVEIRMPKLWGDSYEGK